MVVRQDQAVRAEDEAGPLFALVTHGDLQLHHAGHHLRGNLLNRTARQTRRGLIGGRNGLAGGGCRGCRGPNPGRQVRLAATTTAPTPPVTTATAAAPTITTPTR